jgi:hypothetical protein
VCSVTLTASGSFTAPVGVTTLEALLVGGGGGGVCYDYTGSAAGEVKYVSGISTAGPATVVVGDGGPGDPGCKRDRGQSDGSATVLTDAASVVTSAAGGLSGAGTGTAGTTASAFVANVPGNVALWPAISGEACFAQDGGDGPARGGVLVTDPDYFGNVVSVLACGAGTPSDTVKNDPAGDGAFADALASTGSGGGASAFNVMSVTGDFYQSSNGAGGSGFVTFRYPMSQVFEATLASTGPASAGLAWASAVLTALGVALVGASRRVRRNATV